MPHAGKCLIIHVGLHKFCTHNDPESATASLSCYINVNQWSLRGKITKHPFCISPDTRSKVIFCFSLRGKNKFKRDLQWYTALRSRPHYWELCLSENVNMCYSFFSQIKPHQFFEVYWSLKGELRRKMNLWSNYTLLHSQPLSEICFHDCRM